MKYICVVYFICILRFVCCFFSYIYISLQSKLNITLSPRTAHSHLNVSLVGSCSAHPQKIKFTCYARVVICCRLLINVQFWLTPFFTVMYAFICVCFCEYLQFGVRFTWICIYLWFVLHNWLYAITLPTQNIDNWIDLFLYTRPLRMIIMHMSRMSHSDLMKISLLIDY